MKKETVLSTVGQHYAEAYEKQYDIKDSHAALLSYKSIVAEYPDSKEAENSRSQIQNIMRNTVPKEVLYEAQLQLALNYTEPDVVTDTPPVTRIALA
ncbi:MAG: hypothetical protein JW863_03985 [Chitinispirillaceae bacterium]|nr:hypothetical protein [Chitinispirillaceae bacterium]